MNVERPVNVLAVMDRARNVLAETYAKYQTKIGPFATQSQKANGELREARDAVADLIRAITDYRESLQAMADNGSPEDLRRWEAAEGRLNYALARVGGAA